MVSKLQLNKSGIISKDKNEKGFVILGSLVILSLIALVASIALTTTFTDIKISSNYKTSKQAFYIAEAGVQRAKAELRTAPFDDVLDGNYGGSPGVLSFGANTAFGNGTCNVTVQDNNDGDEDTSVDSDNIVYIIGTGLKNGSKSSVELKIQKTLIPLPPIPAPITIIGEANVFIDDSDYINVDGRNWRLIDDDVTGPTGLEPAKYAIALSNIGAGESPQTPAEAIADLDLDIQDFQEANFVGIDTASYTESIGLDSGMTSQELQDFVDMAKQVADNSIMASDVPSSGAIPGSSSGPNNQITIGSQTIELGSVNNPKITYFNMKPDDNGGIDRIVHFQNDITGSGILIVEGNDLGFREYLSWTGVVIVIGDDVGGGLMGDGSKEQTITGAFIVDEQEEDYPEHEEVLLMGNVNVRYSSEAVNLAQNLVLENDAGNIIMLTWRQVLND